LTALIKNVNNYFQKVIDFALDFINRFYWVFFCALCFLVAFLCFYNLGDYCVLDWDEARHGVSAYEMLKSDNWFVNTYNYEADYWNLKPVFSFWPIALSFKIFGASVFSLRITSAVSMVFLAVCVGIFTLKKFGRAESIGTMLVFCACTPFYIYHCARNGDADSLFLLFYSLAVMLASTKRYFHLSGLCLSLGFLTKSWHIGTAVLIVVLCFVINKTYKKVSKKHIVIFFILSVLPIVIWGLLRYSCDDSKFFEQMIMRDLLARSSEQLENHSGGILFYAEYLYKSIPLIIALAVILLGFYVYISVKNRRKPSQNAVTLAIWFVLPLMLYSLMSTKLQWYIYPVCVPLCIFCGAMTVKAVKSINIVPIIKTMLVCFFAYSVCSYTVYFAGRIQNPNRDQLQNFITENVKKESGLAAFIEVFYPENLTEDNWSQSALFLAEIYGDYNCFIGGIEGFKDCQKNAVLITEKDRYISETGDSIFSDYTLVASDEIYVMLKK